MMRNFRDREKSLFRARNPFAKDGRDESEVNESPKELANVHGGVVDGSKDVAINLETMPTKEDARDDCLQPIAYGPPELSLARRVALVGILSGAAFLNTSSVQSIVIVLPTVGNDLNIPEARQQWVVSAYALPFACFLLFIGRIADIYGKKNMFIIGSVGVCIFLVATPFAPGEISFDVLRGLQGISGACNVPAAIGIIGATFPQGKSKNYAVSIYSSGFPLGSIVGNILGGVVGSYLNWKWTLWIQAIPGAMIAIASFFIIPTVKPTAEITGSRFRYLMAELDWLGATLITLGLLCVMFALTEANLVGWSRPYIAVLIVVGALLIGTFILWQYHLENRTTKQPLLKMSIWANRRFASAQIIQALSFGAFNNFLIYATFYFQNYQGLSILQTTLRFLPTGVAGVTTALLSSQLLGRVPGQYLLIGGSLCVVLSTLLMAIPIPSSTSYWAYAFEAMVLSVMGVDTLYPCVTLFTIQSLSPENQSLGGAIVNVSGQVGRILFLALTTSLQVSVQEKAVARGRDAQSALLAGYRAAEWFSSALALLGLLFAIFVFRGAGVLGAKK